jgi:hypothetical protein
LCPVTSKLVGSADPVVRITWSDDGTSLGQTNVSRHFETCGDPSKVRRGLENAGPS